MKELNKEEKEMEELKEKFGISKINKLSVHDDADGLSSGILLTYVFKTAEVMAPDVFGEVEDSDVCVDMKPVDPNWPGLCFDHHPGHPDAKDRKYKLVWGDEPATKIVYDTFKQYIPEKHHWKMAIGTAGDGRAELVPIEIWRKFPLLLSNHSAVYEKYGSLKLYPIPIYTRIISGINAACKIPGKWYSAYTILRASEDPLDILEDDAINLARRLVNEETRRVVKEHEVIELNDYIRAWVIESEYRIQRGLAWRAEQLDHKTSVVLNSKTGAISIRGILAELICEELGKKGYELGGHPGFSGGQLKEGQDYKELLKALKDIKL